MLNLELGDPSTWDDTALIEAFDRAAASHKQQNAITNTAHYPHAAAYIKKKRKNVSSPLSPLPPPPPPPPQQQQQLATLLDARPPHMPSMYDRSHTLHHTPTTTDNGAGRANDSADFGGHMPPLRAGIPPYMTDMVHMPEKDLGIPAPPPALLGAVGPDVEKMLLAWYEAGYRAGAYATSHGMQKE